MELDESNKMKIQNENEVAKQVLDDKIESKIIKKEQKSQEKPLNGLNILTNDIVNRKTLSSCSDSVTSDSSSENEEMINMTKRELNSNKENNEDLLKKRKNEMEKVDLNTESFINKKTFNEAECLQAKKICVKQQNGNVIQQGKDVRF